MRIGILGGTFDPVHKGHLHLAKVAGRKLRLNRVYFVPAYLAPHKSARRRFMTSAAARLAMLRLDLRGEEAFCISRFELGKKRKVYTLETVKEFRRRFPPPHELFLLTGADNFAILNRWRNVSGICCRARFIIASRPGFPVKRHPGIIRLSIPPVNVSSSDIRRRLKKRLSVKGLISPRVARYIRANKLYGKAQSDG